MVAFSNGGERIGQRLQDSDRLPFWDTNRRVRLAQDAFLSFSLPLPSTFLLASMSEGEGSEYSGGYSAGRELPWYKDRAASPPFKLSRRISVGLCLFKNLGHPCM